MPERPEHVTTYRELELVGRDSQSLPGAAVWLRALDLLPLGAALIDCDTGIAVWVNRNLSELILHGVGATDAVGLAPYDFLPGMRREDWEEARRSVSRQRSGDEYPYQSRIQFVHYANRNIAYWEWSLVNVDSTHGSYLLITVRSITEQVLNERVLASAGKAAERARRRAEALMRLTQLVNASLTEPELLEAITVQAAAYFDSDHAAVLLVDGNALKIGYSIGLENSTPKGFEVDLNSSVAGRAIASRRSQVYTASTGADVITTKLSDGAAPRSLISSPIWRDGCDYGVVEVYFREAREVSESSLAVLAAFADQTAIALHKAELYEQLEAQRTQLQSVIENAPVGITYFDVDGNVLLVNETAAQQYAYKPDQMAALSYRQFLHDLPPGLFDTVRSGTPFHASHHVHSTTGLSQSVWDITLQPVRKDAAVIGILMITFPVTELVNARQEADIARQAAEDLLGQVQATQRQLVQMEKMRALGELSSGVSHDFNNALQAILGYTELAADSLDDPDELTEHLAIIRKSAEEAAGVVERLQTFARQGVATNGQPTDINAIVKDVITMTRPRWRDQAQREGRSYRVTSDLAPVPLILAEPGQLSEVLLNLVHNALHAMPDGGLLRISTQLTEENCVEVRVQDNGVGMSREVAARIFEPFFTTRGVEGTGLGLAVSWTIVQRHGGVISVDTAPGEGACFVIRLPVMVASEQPAPPPLPRIRPTIPDDQAGLRILVVDDEPFVASVLATILRRNGYRPDEVHSAQEALERLCEADSEGYRAVLTDHGMPGMTGLQLVAEAKRMLPTLPILLLTGWGESLLETYATDTLPDAVLGKPINQSDLLEAVSRVCGAPSNSAQ